MKTRVISGIFLGIITVAAGLLGGPAAGIILAACALVGYHELCRAAGVLTPGGAVAEAADEKELVTVEMLRKRNHTNALEILGYGITALYYAGIIFLPEKAVNSFTLLVIVLLILGEMLIYVVTFPKFHADQIMTAIFAFLYAPLLLSFLYRARCLPHGIYIYTLIFFCTWICDTGAYFAGRFFGKHKMAPILSPKKTKEGAVGGVVSSVILCCLLAVFYDLRHPEQKLHLEIGFMLIGAVGAVISIFGDLAASAVKRNHNIKDYGDCIPGHGGIMDRFDSVIFTAPNIYFLAVLLLRTIGEL